MDTDIRYLELVRADLDDAARRVKELRRRSRDRWQSARPLLAGAGVTLALAGLIGLLVVTGGPSDDAGGGGAVGGVTGGSAATGATGSTAGGNEFQALPGLAAPSTTPAPNDHSGGVPAEGPPSDVSRVIRTGELVLVIPRDSFNDRFSRVSQIADDNGGYVQTSSSRKRAGSLTIRVPAASFEPTLRALRELGDVEVQGIEGRDVTADYVDLHARLRIARSRREVLLRLMDKATTIEQTIRVQNALDDTQLRIEEIQGQLNVLDNRTSLATIQVDLREQGVRPVEEVEKASIPNAFERGVAGFVGVIAGIVVGLGYLLPLMVIAAAAWMVVVIVRRRRVA